MASTQTNFDIDQGADFRLEMTLLDSNNDPIDVSTAVVVGQIRKTTSSNGIEASFTIEDIDMTIGKFAILLPAEVSSQLKCNPSYSAVRAITQFAYDVEIHYADGKVNRILSGVLNVSPEVTR